MTSHSDLGISKRIVNAGKGPLSEYPNETRITFHYQTKKCDEEGTLLDDSRTSGKPMELYLGKKFKLEVWEACLKTMRESEISSFTVDKSHLGGYPIVAKSLRDIRKGKHNDGHAQHCCGLTLKEQGLGYPDLDELLKNPQDLEFTFELQKVELPGAYKKELWTMDEQEKTVAIPRLKEEGNALFKAKDYDAAAEKYGTALSLLEQLVLKEKPGDDDWKALEKQKIPFLLNFSQCKLIRKEYYKVIEHTTEVLDKDPDNVKALYRRAKAHLGAWNPTECKEDFNRVLELDPTLKQDVTKQLKLLENQQKQKDNEDMVKLKGKMFPVDSSAQFPAQDSSVIN